MYKMNVGGYTVLELVGSGAGAVASRELLLPRGSAWMDAAAMGAGSAAGSAVGGFMDEKAGGAKYLFNVQNALLNVGSTAAVHYFLGDWMSAQMGEIPAAFLTGVAGDMISQKLPNLQSYFMRS